VTLARGVLANKHFTRFENPLLAAANGNLNRTIEVHNVLTSWRGMEIVVVCPACLSKYQPGRMERF
tara:strand:+ start:5010 stop:5207 length:198 start_codon:yes stop_codon:yes gene_type:complete